MTKSNSSMQLTRAADYAVRVMVVLAAAQPDARLSLSELARETGTPESFLSKVLQNLAHAGLIQSRRGQAGGFQIAARGLESSMLEVIEAIDGPIVLNVCLTDDYACGQAVHCPAHPVWQKAQHAMLNVLREAKTLDMVQQPSSRPGETALNLTVIGA